MYADERETHATSADDKHAKGHSVLANAFDMMAHGILSSIDGAERNEAANIHRLLDAFQQQLDQLDYLIDANDDQME